MVLFLFNFFLANLNKFFIPREIMHSLFAKPITFPDFNILIKRSNALNR